jgi:hypothetical protein
LQLLLGALVSDHLGMSRSEARAVVSRRIAELRLESYEYLRDRWLDEPDCEEIASDGGETYQVEIEAFWDDPKHAEGNLRVLVSAGSGFFPPSGTFVMAPDGSFVGE